MVRRGTNEAVGDEIVWRSKQPAFRLPNHNAISVMRLNLSELKRAVR
jgi:hypothetical protein